MAVRTPLKIDGTSGLREFTAANTAAIVARMVYLYFTDPSVTLSVVTSSGSLAAITDTRKQAGASNTDVTNFDTAAETANISTKTITYDKISQGTATVSNPTDTGLIKYPVFTTGGHVQAMSKTDMYETFTAPAIDAIVAAQPYKIHTSTTAPTGYTRVSTTAVFSDTRANAGLYTAAGIGEAIDQPHTITNYYLHRKNGSAAASTGAMYIDGDENLREYTQAELDVVLKELIRYTSVNLAGAKLRFYTSGSGTICGTGMTDTILNGSGLYQTRYVNTNDYRAQEFPNGTAVTAQTHYLRAIKE